jgi:hypothetical protein
LSASYLVTAGVGLGELGDPSMSAAGGAMLVPVAGPFIAMAMLTRPQPIPYGWGSPATAPVDLVTAPYVFGANAIGASVYDAAMALLAIDGIVQVTGTVLIVAGAATQASVAVPTRHPIASSIHFGVGATGAAAGFTLAGRF